MFLEFREKAKKAFYKKPIIWPILLKTKGFYYDANYWYYYKSPMGQKNVSVREINLEFNSSCNLRCQFCALDFSKPSISMDPDVLSKVLHEIQNDSRWKNVQQINLYNGGETLLHPKRVEMLQIIGEEKRKAKAAGKPFPKILLLTNGMLLREKLAEQILATDALDIIQFSLDGGTPERFETLRVNAKWQKFYSNVKMLHGRIAESGKKVALKSITIVEEPHALNTKWMHPEFQEIIGLMDHYELRRLHDWGGEVDLGTGQNQRVNQKGCMLLMHQIVVLPNGDVTVCCNDLNSKGVVGNIQQNSLWEIYQSKERRVYLEKLQQGKKDELELCRNCESF